jgi:hypothetical protein
LRGEADDIVAVLRYADVDVQVADKLHVDVTLEEDYFRRVSIS